MNESQAPDITGAAAPRPFPEHLGLKRSFHPQGMTLGVITPLEGFDGPVPALQNHVGLIQQAENAGFATVWVRDVPLLDPTSVMPDKSSIPGPTSDTSPRAPRP